MSEFINNTKDTIEKLVEYALKLENSKNPLELYNQYKEYIEKINPRIVLSVFDELIRRGKNPKDLKPLASKLINVFYEVLKDFKSPTPPENSIIDILMKENREIEKRLDSIKPKLTELNKYKDEEFKNKVDKVIEEILKLKEADKHYLKKENILFPVLEQIWNNHRCFQIMWSIHDDIRESLKKLENYYKNKTYDRATLYIEFGKLYFSMYDMIIRENLIVYPVAIETLTNDLLDKMYEDMFEIGFCFIEPPSKKKRETKERKIEDGVIEFETGRLSIKQLENMLNTLPVDISFVDKDDRVVYFSNPKDRIFLRSKAILGRTVQNCHPPESIHIVNKILDDFKNGRKDSYEFWINFKGRFIYIQYFAVRDEEGNYLGTLEVTQDVTHIRELKGEKRLISEE